MQPRKFYPKDEAQGQVMRFSLSQAAGILSEAARFAKRLWGEHCQLHITVGKLHRFNIFSLFKITLFSVIVIQSGSTPRRSNSSGPSITVPSPSSRDSHSPSRVREPLSSSSKNMPGYMQHTKSSTPSGKSSSSKPRKTDKRR